jgi:MFS family permease
MACSSALTYSTIMSFSAIAPSYIAGNSYEGLVILQFRYDELSLQDQTIQSARVASIIWITSVISSPLFGIFVDRIGLRSRVAIFSAILSISGFLLVVFIHAAFPVFLLGFAFSANFASVWVSIAYIVDRSSIGKAFGVTISLQNIGFTIIPIGNALFKNMLNDYDAV